MHENRGEAVDDLLLHFSAYEDCLASSQISSDGFSNEDCYSLVICAMQNLFNLSQFLSFIYLSSSTNSFILRLLILRQ